LILVQLFPSLSSLKSKSNPQPLIIAHRGASALAPENTLAAFARGFDDGADGFELDVRLARDGIPVVIHDATLHRTGLVDNAIAGMTSTEISEVDVGSWFNRAHPELAKDKYAREAVPSLERVFQFVMDREPVRKYTIYAEMKTDDKRSLALVESVAHLIKRYGFHERVVVASFDLDAIAHLKVIDASIRTGALFAPRQAAGARLSSRKIIAAAAAHRADELLLHKLIARTRLVDAAANRNLPVVVWTVDDPIWLERAGNLKIHALITNNPALFKNRNSAGPGAVQNAD
jgi:glycerophosphoryl diester phosphodiesterase